MRGNEGQKKDGRGKREQKWNKGEENDVKSISKREEDGKTKEEREIQQEKETKLIEQG